MRNIYDNINEKLNGWNYMRINEGASMNTSEELFRRTRTA